MNSKQISFIGLTLVSGAILFFTLRSYFAKTEPLDVQNLKPSQLDFTQSNQLQESMVETESTRTTSIKVINTSALNPVDSQKFEVFKHILLSRNDNDPRIDSELKSMSPELHEALAQQYEALANEDRGGRGKIAFLITRDLKTAKDAEFLQKVLEESPCQSLSNCQHVATDDAHENAVNQTTLLYPQMTVLYQLDKKLREDSEFLNNPEKKNWASSIIRSALQFPVPAVQRRAEEIRDRYNL